MLCTTRERTLGRIIEELVVQLVVVVLLLVVGVVVVTMLSSSESLSHTMAGVRGLDTLVTWGWWQEHPSVRGLDTLVTW